MKVRTLKKGMNYVLVLSLLICGFSIFKKKTKTIGFKPNLNIEELTAINVILEGEDSYVEIVGEEGAPNTVLLSGKDREINGAIKGKGLQAIRVNTSKGKIKIENVTLEGSPEPIGSNFTFTFNPNILAHFLRKNADIKIKQETILKNQTLGGPDDYKIVYVEGAKLTLGDNFTGYGILYIKDRVGSGEPILQMLGNAKWYGLIIIGQEGGETHIFLKGGEPELRIEDFVLLGIENIIIGNNLKVKSGDVGVNLTSGSMVIGNNSEFEASLFADTIILGNNCEVEGNIYYNNLLHGRHFYLEGEEFSPLSLPLLKLPPFPNFSSGTHKIIKGHNEIFYLDPGAYDRISFGNNCTLYLKGGEYRIRKLIMGNNCKIKYLSPSKVMVKNKVVLGNNPRIEPGKEDLDADDCIFYVEGKWDLLSHTGVFAVGNNAKIYCNIYAPYSTIVVGNNAEYEGALIAKRILTGNNASTSLSLKSAFHSPTHDVKIYGGMILIGNKFYIPSGGSNAKISYCREAIEKAYKEMLSRPFNWRDWKEIE